MKKFNILFSVKLKEDDTKTQEASPHISTKAMVIPHQQQSHHLNPETRLFSTSAPEIESPVEWFQVKSKKEKSLEKKMQRNKQLELDDGTAKKTAKVATIDKQLEIYPKVKKETLPSSTSSTVPTTSRVDTREELDFMFDEEIPSTHVGNTCTSNNYNNSFSDTDSDDSDYDYEYDYDDLDDQTISKLVIITQTPPSNQTPTTTSGSTAIRKHGGIDRTGDFLPRSKITADLARAINDGLYYYEQDLKKKTLASSSSRGAFEKTSIVSNEQFSKLKGLESSKSGTASSATTNPSNTVSSTTTQAPPHSSFTDNAHKVTPITIQKRSPQYQQQYAFIPHSLPNDSTLMPSLRQLMSHVHAIKSGTIEGKHARAASNAAGAGGTGTGGGGGSVVTHRNRNNSGSYRLNPNSVSSKFGRQREKNYSSKKLKFFI